MEFKKLSAVEAVKAVSDAANVLIEENGVIKKVPKTAVGGAGSEPDMVITLTGCPVWGMISTDVISITSGAYTDVVDKIWSGTPVDVRIRGTASEGSYLADANEVKATATFYGGALWIKWLCSDLVGSSIRAQVIKFLEDEIIESVSTYAIRGTKQ